MSYRVWARVSTSIPLVALLLGWCFTPSRLGNLWAFVLWCIVAAVIVVNIAFMATMPPKRKPVTWQLQLLTPEDKATTPEDKRLIRSLWVSIPVLGVALNQLFAPGRFGTLEDLVLWIVAAAFLVAIGFIFIATILDTFFQKHH